jgi:hypothetical protein
LAHARELPMQAASGLPQFFGYFCGSLVLSAGPWQVKVGAGGCPEQLVSTGKLYDAPPARAHLLAFHKSSVQPTGIRLMS